jgi:hypothetical protein
MLSVFFSSIEVPAALFVILRGEIKKPLPARVCQVVASAKGEKNIEKTNT